MTKEAKDVLNRWGMVLGIVVALLSIAAVARGYTDDRYVKQSDYQQTIGEMRGDVRVIRAAVCRKDPEACR